MKKLFLLFILSACSFVGKSDNLKTSVIYSGDGVSHITKKSKDDYIKYRYEYKPFFYKEYGLEIEEEFLDNGKMERVYFVKNHDGSRSPFITARADYFLNKIDGYKINDFRNREVVFHNAFKNGEKCELILKEELKIDDKYYIGDESQMDGHFVIYAFPDNKIGEFTLSNGKYEGVFFRELFNFSNNPNKGLEEVKDMDYYLENADEYYFDFFKSQDKAFDARIINNKTFEKGNLKTQESKVVGGKWYERFRDGMNNSRGIQIDFYERGPFFYPAPDVIKEISFDKFTVSCGDNEWCEMKYYLNDELIFENKEKYIMATYGSPSHQIEDLFFYFGD